MWRVIVSHLSTVTRTGMALSFCVLALARATLVLAALRVTASDSTGAVVLGTIASVLYVAQRAVVSTLRVRIECDLHASSTRALLGADVLDVPTSDLEWTLFDGNFYARSALASTLPALAADGLASLALLPLVFGMLPARLLVACAVVLAVVLVSLFGVRRWIERIERRVLDAYRSAMDAVLVAVDGRLEIVARSGEASYFSVVDGALARYRRVAARSRLVTALLGRAPIALGAALCGAYVLVDATSRDALVRIAMANALVLAACAPAFLGVVFGANELSRARTQVSGLIGILEAPRRVAEAGTANVALPSVIDAESLSFSYGPGLAAAFSQVSFAWQPGRPLVLTGPNGSGKSTMLRLLIGLRAPTQGAIRVGGVELPAVDVPTLRSKVALLPQRPYLGQAYHSVRDAMRLARPDATDEAMRASLERTKVLSALTAHGRAPLDVAIGALSTGQRQRVALARVLLRDDARLVLLDEPDANLDRQGIALVASLIEELSSRGVMVAVAAHTRELAEMDAVCIDMIKG